MVGSWSTDAPGGFSDNVIDALLKIQNSLAVAAKMAVLSKLADNMLMTYLGGNAGQRVLSGQIRRGDGETIRAALVDGRHAQIDRAGREGRPPGLYRYAQRPFFDAIADALQPQRRRDPQSFMGDGFLAVYPCDRHREPPQVAPQAAMAAVRQATMRHGTTSTPRRRKDGLGRRSATASACHVGNVMFGNVGPGGPPDLLRLRLGVVNEVAAPAGPDQDARPTGHRQPGVSPPIAAASGSRSASGGCGASAGKRSRSSCPAQANLATSPAEALDDEGA